MENLLKNLLEVGAETKMTSLSDNVSIEISGQFKLEKGAFSQVFCFWAKMYKKYDKFSAIDDYDFEDESAKLNDLPIDNLDKFKKSLEDSGLNTIAKTLNFSREDIEEAMHQHIKDSKYYQLFFGATTGIFNELSSEQKQIENLKYCIENYNTCSNWDKVTCGIEGIDENGDKIRNYVPTIDELKKQLSKLI
jgi:hypothetical protein